MQSAGRPALVAHSATVHYQRHRPEQTTLYRLVQQHAATFFAQAEDAAGADLPQFVKDEREAFLECGILAHGFLSQYTLPMHAIGGKLPKTLWTR